MSERKIPEAFLRRMQMQLGDTEPFLKAMALPVEHGLRVNSLKLTPDELTEMVSWKLSPIPWCPSGFYLEGEEDASRNPLYYAGAYYLQEPSAMLPAAVLPVEPGDRVLDLCAAPGGKSTALAAKLQGRGVLVCNDISASRARALIKNLELFGVTNAVVTAETPERLAKSFSGYFDKILIDAPCSGEGMFRKSRAMITDWTEEKTKEYAALQRDILDHAIRMLRPGGKLLYSTCTYAPAEDEGSVQYLLTHPVARELKLTLSDIPWEPGFLPGNPDWIPDGLPEIRKSVHLIPHLVRGEGHFAALFESGLEEEKRNTEETIGKKLKPDASFAEFASLIRTQYDPQRLLSRDGYLSYVPEDKGLSGRLAGLRILRKGLFLGEIRKNRFEPSQALSMTLSPDSFANCLSLAPDDDRVMRYLKGETLDYDSGEAEKGWVLITLGKLPLGFGKANKGQIKNKYLPGWRYGA